VKTFKTFLFKLEVCQPWLFYQGEMSFIYKKKKAAKNH